MKRVLYSESRQEVGSFFDKWYSKGLLYSLVTFFAMNVKTSLHTAALLRYDRYLLWAMNRNVLV